VVVNSGTSKVVRLDVELEVGLGGDGLEHTNGFAGDFRAWQREGEASSQVDVLNALS
jgi:hypothetical protein